MGGAGVDSAAKEWEAGFLSDTQEKVAKAMFALKDGDPETAFRICEQLVASDDEDEQATGWLCLGFAYEDGTVASTQDLGRALECHRRAAAMSPGPLPLLLMARVEMNIGGDEGFRSGLGHIVESETFGRTLESMLGYAHYYRFGPEQDLGKAKSFYRWAAVRGRLSGFVGYAETAREMGQPGRAFLMGCARVLFAPVIAVVLRRRALEAFVE